MSNIIAAVYGGNGVGKTTFSAALAAEASGFCGKIILASPDVYMPGNALLMPHDKGVQQESLGTLADSPQFGDEALLRAVTPYRKNGNIGLLGYLKDDNADQYNRFDENLSLRLLSAVRRLAEITIVDCANPYEDALSHMALLNADLVFILIEPNSKGVLSYLAQKTLSSAVEGLTAKKVYLASPAHAYSPVEDVAYVVGHPFYDLLPYTEEANTKLCDGDLISKYRSRYAAPVCRCAGLLREAQS